jgi:hypothetical protein
MRKVRNVELATDRIAGPVNRSASKQIVMQITKLE